MKKIFRKITAVLLTLITIISTFVFAFANCNLKLVNPASLSGNQALDLVAVAKANLSKTGAELGATEHWCADFIYNCARLANISESIIPTSGRVSSLQAALMANGAVEVKEPQAGDIVFYGPSHAAIMADSLYAYQGNFSGKGSGEAFWTSSKVVYCKYSSATNYAQYGATFIRPKYKTPVSSAPQKTLTVNYAAGGASMIHEKCAIFSDIIKYKDGKDFNDNWTYNQTKKNGLYNAASFGLYKEGHQFVGWANSAGTVFDEDDGTLKPQQIEPALEKGSCKTLLTASWKPNSLFIHYNANGGTVSTSTKYKLNDETGDIHKLSSGALVSVEWTYNEPKASGLYNASTFSLNRSGYKFLGWSTSPESRIIINQDDGTVLPTDLSEEIKSGNSEVTMYARWEKNHTHDVQILEAKEPTCLESGITEGSFCADCGFVITYQDEIPALGHEFSEEVVTDVVMTCTVAGQTSRHCTRCEEKTDVSVVPAPGHKYQERIDKRASRSSDGKVSTVCSVCGNVKAVKITSKIAEAVLSKTEYLYNGKTRKPSVTVRDENGAVLKKGKDYTVEYSSASSTVPNNYNVKITFIGKYKGTMKLGYSIRPTMVKGVKIKSPEKKKITFTWNKVTGATGYEIFYSTQKDGTYKKLATVKSDTYEYNKMKSGAVIYFRIRAYKYSSNERVCGNFSKTVSVTVK